MPPATDLREKRVLVADDSKFVRTTFAAILKASFGVREEGDGESAWEAVETDPSIVMVFTDLDMPRLNGFGLLARIRGSDDARIRALPVVVISSNEDLEAKQRARQLGANDFIGKTADPPEVLARLDNVLRLVRAAEQATHDALTGTLTPHYLVTEGRKHFAYARRHGSELSVMALRLDSYDEIALAAGKDVADVVLARVGKLLMSKVRVEDSVARTAPATFMVLAAATGAAQMAGLAQRLHRELAAARVTYHDRPLKFAASFGIASLAVDAVGSIEELMRVALVRLHKQQAPPIPAKPAGALPAELESALRVLERVDRARLGPAAADLAERLSRLVKGLS
ncbi:MAG TPA: response regulator [Burkholderiales bacterium]|nr:response regulator [Burkholderiales bacterium]